GAGAADEDAGAETAQGIDGETEDFGDGGGLEREMRTSAGQLAYFGERLGAFALQCVRRAEFAGEREAGRQAVDRDDRVAPRDLRGHQPGETDAADAINRDRLPGSGLHQVEHGAGAGLQTEAER